MTIEELQELDVFYCGTSIKPRQFFIARVGEVTIPETAGIRYLYDLIYEAGFDDGVKRGEKNKIDQFRKLLNIEVNDY